MKQIITISLKYTYNKQLLNKQLGVQFLNFYYPEVRSIMKFLLEISSVSFL